MVRYCDTVTFFPTTVPFPEIKLGNFLRQAAHNIISILTNPPSITRSILEFGNPVRNALLTLAKKLSRIENIPNQHTTTPVFSPTVKTPTLLTHYVPIVSAPRVGRGTTGDDTNPTVPTESGPTVSPNKPPPSDDLHASTL